MAELVLHGYCVLCGVRSHLARRCVECGAVYYCKETCRQDNANNHYPFCARIVGARKAYNNSRNMMNVALASSAHLRSYLISKAKDDAYSLLDAYLSVQTIDALKEALEIAKESLRFFPIEEERFQIILFTILLRLRYRLKCYSLLLWIAKYGRLLKGYGDFNHMCNKNQLTDDPEIDMDDLDITDTPYIETKGLQILREHSQQKHHYMAHILIKLIYHGIARRIIDGDSSYSEAKKSYRDVKRLFGHNNFWTNFIQRAQNYQRNTYEHFSTSDGEFGESLNGLYKLWIIAFQDCRNAIETLIKIYDELQ